MYIFYNRQVNCRFKKVHAPKRKGELSELNCYMAQFFYSASIYFYWRVPLICRIVQSCHTCSFANYFMDIFTLAETLCKYYIHARAAQTTSALL